MPETDRYKITNFKIEKNSPSFHKSSGTPVTHYLKLTINS